MTDRRELDLVIPGDLDTRTGGFIYDRRIVERLRCGGWRVNVHELDTSFPLPSIVALREAAAVLARIPDGRQVVIDGLALGGMAAIAVREAKRLRLIALIHHPLALETGLAEEVARQLFDGEKLALAAVSRVIVTSRTTVHALSDYSVSTARITVVPPGTDPAPLATGSGSNAPDLLCVATLTQRKGHSNLFEALAGLHDREWHLTCVGSSTRDPVTAGGLSKQIEEIGLADRITLTGELEDSALRDAYTGADAFVLASHYEGYGMVLAEALARGLPIVACAGGAVAETVPANAGLLVPPADPCALRTALARLIDDRELRARLRWNARRVRHTLPTWEDAGTRFAAVLNGFETA